MTDIEVEANSFAMELLMPEAWLRRDVKALGGIDLEDEKEIRKLADRYRVGEQIMTLRLGQLLKKV